jgi:hypothetical protein
VFEFTVGDMHWRHKAHNGRIKLYGRCCRMTVRTDESAVIDNNTGTTCARHKELDEVGKLLQTQDLECSSVYTELSEKEEVRAIQE